MCSQKLLWIIKKFSNGYVTFLLVYIWNFILLITINWCYNYKLLLVYSVYLSIVHNAVCFLLLLMAGWCWLHSGGVAACIVLVLLVVFCCYVVAGDAGCIVAAGGCIISAGGCVVWVISFLSLVVGHLNSMMFSIWTMIMVMKLLYYGIITYQILA